MKNIVALLICIIIIKIGKGQTNLDYSTYIGGIDSDLGLYSVFDSKGNLVIVGSTRSKDFPLTANALHSRMVCDTTEQDSWCWDILIMKFDIRKNKILFSTFLGGSSQDTPNDIAIDKHDNLYITGNTHSYDFPVTKNAYQKTMKGCGKISHCEHFITKIDMNSYSIVYSTFLGGSDGDMSLNITLDEQGNAILAGTTSSSDYPITPNAFDTTFNGGELDGIVAKLNPDGSKLLFSAYLGGSGDADRTEGISDVAVDNKGFIYVTGQTTSNDFPTTSNAFDKIYNGGTKMGRGGNAGDCFLTVINPEGSEIVYSTFIGGSQTDEGNQIIVDRYQNIFIAGTTSSSDFPVTNEAFQKTNNGKKDVFVLIFNPEKTILEACTLFGGSDKEDVHGIFIDYKGDIFLSGCTNSSDLKVTDDAFDKECKGSGWNKEVFIARINPTLSEIGYLTYFGGSENEIGGCVCINQRGSICIIGSTSSNDFPVTETAYDKTYKGGHKDNLSAGIGDIFISKLSNKKFK